MKLRNLTFLLPLIFAGCTIVPSLVKNTGEKPILSGLDVLGRENYLKLKGKKVGLITNQTGVDQNLIQNVDLFLASPNVDLIAVMSPEHGFRGTVSAGEKIHSLIDRKTGIPYFSLYGKSKKPTKEMLQGIDVLVFDIQAIGVRSYTYISTLGLVMETAAENNIELVVLDRPNPLGGLRVEGNNLDPKYKSFIGMYPIPYVYGLTIGELALMINESNWLEPRPCHLTVIKMENWKRETLCMDMKMEWVPPSPHIPTPATPFYVVSTGILGELGVFSNGVGYTNPFHTIAAPWIDENEITVRMNELNLPGVVFRPVSYKPYYGPYEGKDVHGVKIHFLDRKKVNLISLQFYFLEIHQHIYPNKNPFQIASENQINMFDKALGTDEIRKIFSRRFKANDLNGLFFKDVNKFRESARKYYLYE